MTGLVMSPPFPLPDETWELVAGEQATQGTTRSASLLVLSVSKSKVSVGVVLDELELHNIKCTLSGVVPLHHSVRHEKISSFVLVTNVVQLRVCKQRLGLYWSSCGGFQRDTVDMAWFTQYGLSRRPC